VSESVSGAAVLEKRPVNVRDVAVEEPYKMNIEAPGAGMHSELVVP